CVCVCVCVCVSLPLTGNTHTHSPTHTHAYTLTNTHINTHTHTLSLFSDSHTNKRLQKYLRHVRIQKLKHTQRDLKKILIICIHVNLVKVAILMNTTET